MNPFYLKNNEDHLPIYDVFHCRGYHVGIVGPYYSRYGCADLQIKIDGIPCPRWMLPSDRHFTLAVLAEIPRTRRRRDQWQVEVLHDNDCAFKGTIYRQTHPAGSLAMATLTRFDAAYIGEWIDHHLALGFEHFYIYNNGEPKISKALGPYLAEGITTEIAWKYPYAMYNSGLDPFWPRDSHHYTQPPQQVHACLKYGDNWDWLGLMDADEFLVPTGRKSLPEILDATNDGAWCELPHVRCSGLEIRGKWFGSSGHSETKMPINKNYTRCESSCTAGTKWIVRPADVCESVVHYHETVGQPARVPANVIRYNHYRSISDHKKRHDHNHYSNETTR